MIIINGIDLVTIITLLGLIFAIFVLSKLIPKDK